MPMIVVESGGTKSTWVFRDKSGVRHCNELPGLHPQEINSIKVKKVLELIDEFELMGEQVYFYGAGCESASGKAQVRKFLFDVGLVAKKVDSDAVGACIAVLGRKNGVAGILGTGAVAAHYDGERVTQMASGRGFILGDEGSGFDIGRRITIAFLDGRFSNSDLNKVIADYYGGKEKIVHACSAQDSRFLIAGLTKVIAPYRSDDNVKQLITEAFNDFVTTAILPLPDHKEIGVVGSVGYNFKTELEEVFNIHAISLSKVVPAAAEAMFDFIDSK